MQSKAVRFKSAFICEVIINEDFIELIDSGHMSFFIETSNDDVMSQFKDWFVNVYKVCKPQTLTVMQYHPVNEDDEVKLVLDKLIFQKACTVTMLNESAKEKMQ